MSKRGRGKQGGKNKGGKKKGGTPTEQKLRVWVEARKRHHLTHGQVQMARELGLNPRKLGKLDNSAQEPWKEPLPQYIERLYKKRFGRDRPEEVLSLEERARLERARRARRREERARRRAEAGVEGMEGAEGMRSAEPAGPAEGAGSAPESPQELRRLIERYVQVKQALVRDVQRSFADVIGADARRRSPDGELSEAAIVAATEALLHARPTEAGQDPIDRFLAGHPRLPRADRALTRGFRDAVTGVFRVQQAEGRVVDVHNLVDALDYRLVLTNDEPAIWQRLAAAGFFAATVIPLSERLWTLSGSQQLLDPARPEAAAGVAARLALDHPRLFFRNPEHLARGWAALRAQHDRFVARFGGPWVVGEPEAIQALHQELLGGAHDGEDAADRARAPVFDLPAELMAAETVGLLSHPRGGLHVLREFGRFVAAFEPEAVGGSGDPKDLEVVSGYLEAESIDPVVFEVVAGADPEAATRVFRRLLGSDAFDWRRDGEALLRRHKPAFFAQERLPFTIGLNAELAEGLQALERTEQAERG